MSDRSHDSDSQALKNYWRRWTVIVDLFARRRPARRRVDPIVYNALHQELIAACRARADAASEDSRAYFDGLEELARPWLNPRALANADREILDSLLARCRVVEAELGGQPWFPRLLALGWIRGVLLPGLALAGSILLLWASGVDFVAALDHAQGWSDVIWLTVKRASDLQKLAVVAALVLLASIYGVSRTARS